MEELKKINSKIAVKQIGRIVGGSCFMVLGMVLVARHMYQKGITDCQKSISKEFPDEYAAITKKIKLVYMRNKIRYIIKKIKKTVDNSK